MKPIVPFFLAACIVLLCPVSRAMTTEDAQASAVNRRLAGEREQSGNPWVILPYRPNYILPITYSDHPNNQPLRDSGDDKHRFEHWEIKFQLSLMVPVLQDALWNNGDLCIAYSQVSFWNAYNSELSEPFRDTNYEPEMFLRFDTDFDVLGMKNRLVSVGFVHQSNGRGSDVLSRSWNRVYANSVLERGNFVLKIRPWYRIPEDETEDDNPDIEKYLGYGDITMAYTRGSQVFSALVRDNLRTEDNKGALELGWSFPVSKRFKGFVQYFTGYGESLLDYNVTNQRLGIGVLLSDWL